MSYQALYRVWRPRKFQDVVGQTHITRTLQNAIIQEKFSHAYLFSGPRGTGKTSAAKIFAKTINCEHAPVKEPCNECAACRGIQDGSISDVIEIDAASNTSVDDIREIRDKVKYASSVVPYKVYIIDEVHMISVNAFNALLKTLEEPPKHVVFILATTEPHKIPLTILSRCQRFD
ncbi:DNA polymerase III subunit gamma/tau, partial [Virgibacillus halodenitrificans]|nr:DNA polymerase III subunit gamma/tau [Virgibacillus halodenitrificans]